MPVNTLQTHVRRVRYSRSDVISATVSTIFQEYFKSTSSSTISKVKQVFNNVVSECGSSTSGVSKTYCTDVYGNGCSSNVLAYTLPSGSYIVNCEFSPVSTEDILTS